jgi:formylglycine-generating enzyme required for sulfatase activity
LDVAGGTFYRTYDVAFDAGVPIFAVAADGGPVGEADPTTISTFKLDKYEVTVARFRQFVSAWEGGWLPAPGSGKHAHLNNGQGLPDPSAGLDGSTGFETGWLASNNSDVAPTPANLACSPGVATFTASAANSTVAGPHANENESKPINCVTWAEAYAFCIWDGGFLPTRAEWEYTAAGGSQQREYPWGSADPGAGFGFNYAIFGGGMTAPVGTTWLGGGGWGQQDLEGNVSELTLERGTALGAAFDDDASRLHVSDPKPRYLSLDAASRYPTIGFRCARAP